MEVYDELSRPLALAAFAATLLLPIVVGILARRRTRTESDFFVGGRAVHRVVVALSAVSSGRSSWLVLGVSGMAFARGASAVWAVVGYTLVEAVQFLWIGRRLRTEAQSADAVTLFDWFGARFDGDGVAVRVTGALISVVFLTGYVAAQLIGGAKTLGAALGLPHAVALTAAALLILVYMLLGGYIAVAWNDVVRALIMLLALVVLPAAALVRIGGVRPLWAELARLDPALVDPLALSVGALVGFLGIGLGSPGQPHILVRYISIDDPRNLLVSALWGTAFNVLLGGGAVAVGLAGRAIFASAPALPGRDQEMVYLVLASELFGPLLFGLLVGGVFAAILSTADSQLLVVASTLVRDLWEAALRRGRDLDEAAKLGASRVALAVAAAAALALALLARDLVFWLVLFAWGGLGAALGPPLICGLWWRGTRRAGVLAGMITGTGVTIAWKMWLAEATGLYELVPAFLASLLAVVVGSLASHRSGRRRVRG